MSDSNEEPPRLIQQIVRLQTRPVTLLFLLLFAIATAAASLLAASKLQLRTNLGELLPQSKESVRVAERAASKLGTASLLVVVAEGTDDEALKRFADAAAPALAGLDPSLVSRVDEGVHESQDFLKAHRLLYAPLEVVQQIHDDVLERYDQEVLRRAGASVEDDATGLTEASVRQQIAEGLKKNSRLSKRPEYPDGYYLDRRAHAIAILVRTPIASGDLAGSRAVLQAASRAIASVQPSRFDPTIRVGFTGDLVVSAEEHAQVKDDLSRIGVWGVGLVLGAVLLFYLRLRPLVVLTLAVGLGTAWTFAVAYLLIGYLNTSSGLLFSIVIGNGINFGIIYLTRFLEARRVQDVAGALCTAHGTTWLATLAAAASAATAYGSLVVTDFRGFKHFGIIGGSGMLLCWIATYLIMPPILVVFERLAPVRPSRLDRFRALYGRPFAFLVERCPRGVVALGLCVGFGGLLLAARYIHNDPIEYDLSNVRNGRSHGETDARRLARMVKDFVSLQDRNSLAIPTDSLAQVLPLKEALEARRDRLAVPPDKRPIGEVLTIYDLLPKDQEAKVKLLNELSNRLEAAHRKRLICDVDYARLRQEIPQESLAPLSIEDLPEPLVRPFQVPGGQRGALVYVLPTVGRSVWDARYLVEWASTIRETELPDHTVVKASNSQVVFADMFLSMLEDAPKALYVSLCSTLLLVVLAFRGKRRALWVLGALSLGLTYMIAALSVWPWAGGPAAASGVRLNFLNFIALPITIGVGADYAINMVQRHRLDRDAVAAVRQTGGAVILCSLTTILGYVALTFSVNQAVRSFGLAAALGEASCLLSAVVVLPAALFWYEKRDAPWAEHERTAKTARSV